MKVLFLCTGNFYRSRFAEEYFNHLAKREGLQASAYSLGLMRDFSGNGNVGPISQDTLAELNSLGIEPLGHERMPDYVYLEHFDDYDLVIAVSRSEHTPMVKENWPGESPSIEYFDVEDLHLEGPETALPRLRRHVEGLIERLRGQA